ncbi:Integrase [Paramagnetospirillum magnetotacticum MS-1]|uniref:Integrase n=1 Tax=Paramagnetospirillum magnetotacticum MS-1 TaxID=272627 RepID=A0A0C2YL66_PARME|nr:Integrase [Paramagnetospirillum magnetotacticum MS-1]
MVGRAGTPKKASTIETDKYRVNALVRPALGKLALADIDRKVIEKFMNDVALGKIKSIGAKTAKNRGRTNTRGGRGAATRTIGLLGGILAFGVKEGEIPSNPVIGIKRFKDTKNERFLSGEELAKLGDVLRQAEANFRAWEVARKAWEGDGRQGKAPVRPSNAEAPAAIGVIRLLALTGMRRGEALALDWGEVDFEYGLLQLADSKTGRKSVPLGAAARQLLAAIPKPEGGGLVFRGPSGGPVGGLPHIWERIRKRAGLDGVRLHDLRHSYAAVGASGGQSLPILGAILGHSDTATTQRYAHLTASPVQAAADLISKNIAAALDGRPAAKPKRLRVVT